MSASPPAELPRSANLPVIGQTEDLIADPEPDAASGWAWDVTKPANPGWEDYYRWGTEAFGLGQAIEKTDGLGAAAIAAYHEASVNLTNVVAAGPIDRRGRLQIPDNPARKIMVAVSLARQAQVPGVEFYNGPASSHIDRGSNQHQIARRTLQDGIGEYMDEDAAVAIAGELDAADPLEVVATAAVQAARETGTAELICGPEAVEEDTAERLRTEGEAAIAEFIKTHSIEPDRRGAELVAKTGILILEQMTDTPELALAA